MNLSRYSFDDDGYLGCEQCGDIASADTERPLPLSQAVSAANLHEWEAHRKG